MRSDDQAMAHPRTRSSAAAVSMRPIPIFAAIKGAARAGMRRMLAGGSLVFGLGCVIIWSPDGRFLAVHGEDLPGIAIVDIASGERGQLTHEANDIPLQWTE